MQLLYHNGTMTITMCMGGVRGDKMGREALVRSHLHHGEARLARSWVSTGRECLPIRILIPVSYCNEREMRGISVMREKRGGKRKWEGGGRGHLAGYIVGIAASVRYSPHPPL